MELEEDAELRAGLDAILAPLRARNASPEELQSVEDQARAYYQSQQKPVNGDTPAYPSSFSEIASLIAAGQPIPGIKQIPDRLNDAPSSSHVLETRKKPWELHPRPELDEATVAAMEQPSIRFIFGYGSLIWKPPPHAIRRQPGYIKGFVRRFAQYAVSSSDHRGTPEAPGRVVTLIPSPTWKELAPSDVHIGQDDRVWGVCYEIDPVHAVAVRAHLDYREKDGYSTVTVDVWHDDNIVIPEVYVGHPDAHSFIGPEPIDQLGAHIYKSHGPSGANKDYLYHLAAAVRELDRVSHDDYLDALERQVRKHEQREIRV